MRQSGSPRGRRSTSSTTSTSDAAARDHAGLDRLPGRAECEPRPGQRPRPDGDRPARPSTSATSTARANPRPADGGPDERRGVRPPLAPATGDWTIRVRAQNVPQGGRQPFALVATGSFGGWPDPPPKRIYLRRRRILVLEPARPNPFSRSTSIGFSFPREANARLTVHDAAGARRHPCRRTPARGLPFLRLVRGTPPRGELPLQARDGGRLDHPKDDAAALGRALAGGDAGPPLYSRTAWRRNPWASTDPKTGGSVPFEIRPQARDAAEVRARHEANRIAWNEGAVAYREEIEETVRFLRAGGSNLHPVERANLGVLKDWCATAIHLQCASGRDTLSLRNEGVANLVGIDISDLHIENARATATALGWHAAFVRCDVLDTPHEFDGDGRSRLHGPRRLLLDPRSGRLGGRRLPPLEAGRPILVLRRPSGHLALRFRRGGRMFPPGSTTSATPRARADGLPSIWGTSASRSRSMRSSTSGSGRSQTSMAHSCGRDSRSSGSANTRTATGTRSPI